MNQHKRGRRAVIYGAGAIGGVVGALLARAGKEALLLGRPGNAAAINASGLRLVTPAGTDTVRLPAVSSLDQIDFRENDVVFLCVKSQDTPGALAQLYAAAGDLPVFCFQNGVRNEELAARRFSRVYGVKLRSASVFLQDGEVISRWEPPGWLVMGRYPTGTDELVNSVAADLRAAGFYVLVTADIMPHKWGKLLENLPNAAGAITDAKGEEVNRISRAARQEAEKVLTGAGIRWVAAEELARQWPESSLPYRSLETRAQSSTWQSLARRKSSVESDYFHGEIVRLAEKLGLPAPVNQALLRISEEMAARGELPGKYTPAQLARLAGLG